MLVLFLEIINRIIHQIPERVQTFTDASNQIVGHFFDFARGFEVALVYIIINIL